MGMRIDVDTERIADFCRKHHVQKLAFFGSVLRGDFGAESDVDVLVEFEAGQEPGFLRLAEMEMELSKIIGRQADMRTPEDLSRYFRDEVVSTAEVKYAA